MSKSRGKCGKLHAFGTRRDAEAWLQQEFGSDLAQDRRAHYCKRCKAWHVTRRKFTNLKKAKEKGRC